MRAGGTAIGVAILGCPLIVFAVEVEITWPLDGAAVLDRFVVAGQSVDATTVSLQVDNGSFEPVDGLDSWTVVFESGSILRGPHTLTARAEDGIGGVAFDSVSITVGDPAPGAHSFGYLSSVDGQPLTAVLWIPEGYDPDGGPAALLTYLHGSGGDGTVLLEHADGSITNELDARGWIGIAPDGRRWGLHDLGCPWEFSSAYVDSPDPDVGPGEQDVLDAVDWITSALPIDTQRVYLTGFSLGGRGAHIIGLQTPDRFAAIGALAPTIDMYELFARDLQPQACFEGIAGGQPGDNSFVDTMYSITSGRFLIENAYNLPIFHGHGLLDTLANNDPSNAPFLHGWHITSDSSWDGCHGDTELCFGHTPTLSELHELHPAGYDWAFMFTPVGHTVDARWIQGTPVNPDIFGVEDPQNPGFLLGMMDFLEQHTLIHDPETVVYQTYTDTHSKAYWTRIAITTPWLDTPGAIRASRDETNNVLNVELIRVSEATFDLPLAHLRVVTDEALVVIVEPLVEPVFDPALEAPGEPLQPTLVLADDFSEVDCVSVLRDGVPLEDDLINLTASELTLGPLAIEGITGLLIQAIEFGDFDGDGDVDLIDLAAFNAAFTGPGGQTGSPGCHPGDFDFDGDIDLLDFADFQSSFTGP